MHRTRPHDPVQLADALEALGTPASESDEPSTLRRGARLEPFGDPRASALRHRVVEALHELGA